MRWQAWLVIGIVAGSVSARAQTQSTLTVQLRTPAPISAHVAAFPRIVAPNPAQARINAALARQEALLRRMLAECRKAARSPDAWQRSMAVPMRGPGYLALVASDADDCGSAHPETSAFVIVYDLRTGSPVDWSHLLPAGLLGRQRLVGAPGAKIVIADSKPMRDRYRAGYRTGSDSTDDAECRHDLGGDAISGFLLYPDANAGGLALLPNGLVHIVDAICNQPVVIPAAELRALGAAPALVGAIQAAHAAVHPPG